MISKLKKCIAKHVKTYIKKYIIKRNAKHIEKVAKVATNIKTAVASDYNIKNNKEELKILEAKGLKGMDFMPSAFDIAKYFGIRCEFKEIEGNEPSYLLRRNMIIYISEKYREDSYATRQLLAHELGHFFLHKKSVSEMNIFPHRKIEEYEANVFSIFIMPQIAEGEPWENLSPKELNLRIYNKVFKKDD